MDIHYNGSWLFFSNSCLCVLWLWHFPLHQFAISSVFMRFMLHFLRYMGHLWRVRLSKLIKIGDTDCSPGTWSHLCIPWTRNHPISVAFYDVHGDTEDLFSPRVLKRMRQTWTCIEMPVVVDVSANRCWTYSFINRAGMGQNNKLCKGPRFRPCVPASCNASKMQTASDNHMLKTLSGHVCWQIGPKWTTSSGPRGQRFLLDAYSNCWSDVENVKT